MAERIRKKTAAELAAQEFQKRGEEQAAVLMKAYAECEKLSASRKHFIQEIAGATSINRLDDFTEASMGRESRRRATGMREFIRSVRDPLEVHCFTCHWDVGRGIKPLITLVKSSVCDAGTALRLFWINDPVYYSQYRSVLACPEPEEQEALRLLAAIKRRFQRDDFATRNIYFDPRPWTAAEDVDLEPLPLPPGMLQPVP